MAYTPCTTAQLAGHAQENCTDPASAGLKVLGIIINKNDISSITFDTSNPNIVEAITLETGAKTYMVEGSGENAWADSGYEYDPATKAFTKNATFVAPDYGAIISSKFLDPLSKNSDGFVVILQRKNTRGDGSFVIVGLETGAVVTTHTMNMTDEATNGCATLTLTEKGARKGEINLFDTDYQSSLVLFNTLKSAGI